MVSVLGHGCLGVVIHSGKGCYYGWAMATSNSIENGGFKLLIYGDFYGKGYDSS
jgi:hypothetical protein